MPSNLYVALSAQVSLQRRMETLAHNVANASTAGFRAEEVKFDTLLSMTPTDPVSYVSGRETYISRAAGELTRTDNPLDVAVQGDAWLAFLTPGGPVYTRDGRMTITPAGELQTLTGHPVLDVGGAPILLDANAGPPQIARDGTITQQNRQIGALGLFTIDSAAKLTRFDTSGVIPDRPAQPALDFGKVGVSQGFVERANVNPVMEMTTLIMVSRAFEAVTASINQTESSLEEAIRALGPSS